MRALLGQRGHRRCAVLVCSALYSYSTLATLQLTGQEASVQCNVSITQIPRSVTGLRAFQSGSQPALDTWSCARLTRHATSARK